MSLGPGDTDAKRPPSPEERHPALATTNPDAAL